MRKKNNLFALFLVVYNRLMKKLNSVKKKKVLKIVLTLLGLILFSGLVIIILQFGFNINLFTNDGALVLKDTIGYSWWGVIVYLLLYVLIVSTTSFIPGTSMAMILLGATIFEGIGGFAITMSGVMLTSLLLYLLGLFGGRKVGNFILGEEDIEKATRLLETKGQVYLPLMLMFPMFPDDALCFASGVLKMKWWYFTLIALFFRGVGVLTLNLLGGEVGSYIVALLNVGGDLPQTIMNWFMFITALAFWLIVIFYLANKLDKYLEKKRDKQ